MFSQFSTSVLAHSSSAGVFVLLQIFSDEKQNLQLPGSILYMQVICFIHYNVYHNLFVCP